MRKENRQSSLQTDKDVAHKSSVKKSFPKKLTFCMDNLLITALLFPLKKITGYYQKMPGINFLFFTMLSFFCTIKIKMSVNK